jgi:hypothetical protein
MNAITKVVVVVIQFIIEDSITSLGTITIFSFTGYKDNITTIHYYYNSSPRHLQHLFVSFYDHTISIVFFLSTDPHLAIEDDINFFRLTLNDTLYVPAWLHKT